MADLSGASQQTTHRAGTRLDQAYRRVTTPIARSLAGFPWVTPNRVSVAAFVAGGVVTPILIALGLLVVAGLVYVVSDALDYLDGDVARAQGTSSTRGDMLDGILDRYTDLICASALALFATGVFHDRPPLVLGGIRPAEMVAWTISLAAVVGCVMPAYVQALAVATDRPTTQSIGGRGTRNRVVFVGLLVQQPLLTLLVLAILSNVAAIQRAAAALSEDST